MTPAERVAALELTGPFMARSGDEEDDWKWLLSVAKAAVAWREATLAGMLVREAENALLAAIGGTTKEAP